MRRHVIALFTDSSAHKYKQQSDGIPSYYPSNMFRNLGDLFQAWGSGQDALSAGHSSCLMEKEAKRMVLFAPSVYPQNDIEVELGNVSRKDLNKGNGGCDLNLDGVITLISNPIA